jgi:hypothetical protein
VLGEDDVLGEDENFYRLPFTPPPLVANPVLQWSFRSSAPIARRRSSSKRRSHCCATQE